MAIKEERPNYRKPRNEKQHVKLWGNAVLILLLISVLGGIYAYLRYDGLNINSVLNNNGRNNGNNTSEQQAKYDFIDELKSGSGSIFDDIEPAETTTPANNNTAATAEPASNAQTVATKPPVMTSLDGNPSESTSSALASTSPANTTAKPETPASSASNQPNKPAAQTNTNIPEPFQAKPVAASATQPETPKPTPSPQPEPKPEQPAVVNTAPPVVKPKPEPPATPAQPVTQTPAQPAAQKPIEQKPVTTPAAAPSNQASGAIFQLGSYREHSNAENMRANLAFMGINSRIISERGLHIVVTDAKNGVARQQIEQRLKQQGISYFQRH